MMKDIETVNKRMDIILGLPLSGRKTVLGNDLVKRYDSCLLDLEDMMTLFDEYDHGYGFEAVYLETCATIKEALEYLLECGRNIIQIRTAHDDIDIIRSIRQAQDYGYKVYLHHIMCPPTQSLSHILKRYAEEGIYYPVELFFRYAPDYHDLSEDIYERLKSNEDDENDLPAETTQYHGQSAEMASSICNKAAMAELNDLLIDEFNHRHFAQMDYRLRCKTIHYVYENSEQPQNLQQLIFWNDPREILLDDDEENDHPIAESA